MKIEDKRGLVDDVVFTSLVIGSTFISDEELYLKIEPFAACNRLLMNAVNLKKNFATHFIERAVVRVVDCRVIVEDRR